jgi:hypothetical protein
MMADEDRRSSSRSPSHSQQTDDASRLVESLAKDNETLRAMLRRALGPNAKIDDATVLHLQTALDRSQESLRQERHRRTVAESLVAELRHDREMSLKAKDAELRKLQDAITHLVSESASQHRRSQEDQQVIEVLKRENQRLLDAAMQPRSPSSSISTKAKMASPDYTNLIRSERLRKDIPSCTLKHIGRVPPVTMKREIGHRGAVSGKPRESSASSRSAAPPRPRFEVGQRCTCNRVQGVVRYIGEVVGLGKNMAGVELLVRGAGDNEGSFNGVQYFRVPYRTAMFCPISQLQPAIDTRAVTPLRVTRSSSTSTTPRRCHACPPTERDLQATEASESPMRSLNATRTTAPPCDGDAPVRDNSLVRTDREDVRFSAPRTSSQPTDGPSLYADPSSDHMLSHSMLVRTDDEVVGHTHPPAHCGSDFTAEEEGHHKLCEVDGTSENATKDVDEDADNAAEIVAGDPVEAETSVVKVVPDAAHDEVTAADAAITCMEGDVYERIEAKPQQSQALDEEVMADSDAADAPTTVAVVTDQGVHQNTIDDVAVVPDDNDEADSADNDEAVQHTADVVVVPDDNDEAVQHTADVAVVPDDNDETAPSQAHTDEPVAALVDVSAATVAPLIINDNY